MMKKKLLVLSAVTFLFFSCNKEETVINDDEFLSLEEFFATLPNGSDLLKTLPIVDNSKLETSMRERIVPNLLRANVTPNYIDEEDEDDDGGGPRIKFKWPGLDRYGNACNTSKGICITIPLNHIEKEVPVIAIGEFGSNSILTVIDDKLLIEPTADENGLTSDGYLPIPEYMPLTPTMLIKPGIYAGEPTKIVVDLLELE